MRVSVVVTSLVIILSSHAFDNVSAGSTGWFHFGDWGLSHWTKEICHWIGWCSEVCYDELGCFENTLECHQAFFPPMQPEEIMTTFYVTSRYHPASIIIQRNETDKLSPIGINETDGIVIIIHGWGESCQKQWIQELSKAILTNVNKTMVLVDWYEGADELNYMKAVQNIRVVGREVALLINSLTEENGCNLSDVHIIGHSLGAHVAGYAGEFLQGIGRITALDAAGPAFEGTEPKCRLDESDALFVDAIHTDSSTAESNGIGIAQRIGDCDFYPNGGHDQPGCRFWQIGCNHARSYTYFIESLMNPSCHFDSVICSNETSYRHGDCTPCEEGACPSMGYYLHNTSYAGSFFLSTHRKSPFCVRRY
ncbi:pancreatic triacylglycerol lipase-like [Apostichopus japonicus]|uniref:pancreatic triacylglycerol lipase-like n=1 Tax=Stichopus japonicus TaxID=307972 RepID=UPI003AB2CC74